MGRPTAPAQRAAAVLVWVPVLLARPLVERPDGVGPTAASLLLVVLAGLACSVAVLRSWPCPTPSATAAWVVLLGVVLVAATQWAAWSPAWLLVAMAAGAALPVRSMVPAVAASALLAALTAARLGDGAEVAWTQAFVVALAGTTAAVVCQLILTAERLRRTREQLAVAAVAAERDRVSRDLHDVLGHTLSVMVVNAAAARRLIPRDPVAAARHAEDVESVGREALSRVREVVRGASSPTLEEELAVTREVLSAAGVTATVPEEVRVPPFAGEPLAWALREGVTNLLRHSGARSCRVALSEDGGGYALTVTDDGTGGPGTRDGWGGLDGLRARLEGVGGGLTAGPTGDGFVLTAWVPGSDGRA